MPTTMQTRPPISGPPGLGRVGKRRESLVDAQADDVKVIVRQQRRVVAVDATGFADKQPEALPGFLADGIAVAGNEAVERRVAAHQLTQVRLN